MKNRRNIKPILIYNQLTNTKIGAIFMVEDNYIIFTLEKGKSVVRRRHKATVPDLIKGGWATQENRKKTFKGRVACR